MDLLVIALAAVSIWHGRSYADGDAFLDAQNTSKLLSQNLVATFEKFDMSLTLLKDAVEGRDARGDMAAIEAAALRLFKLHPELEYLRMADADGHVIAGSGLARSDKINIAARDYFVRLRDDPQAGLVFSKPIVGYASGKWSIVLARRVNTPSSAFAGIVFAVISLDWIQSQFATVNLGSKGAISLRALDLSTVARYPPPEAAGIQPGNPVSTQQWREKLAQNPESGTYTAVSLDGFARSLAYRRVGPYPFYVIVGLWSGDYLDKWRQEALVIGLLAAVVVLVSTLIARAWSRREQDSRHIAELQGQALYQSRLHLNVAVESARMGVWVTDPVTGEMTASNRAKQLYGLTGDGRLDHDQFLAAICPDDRGRVNAAFQLSMRRGEPFDTRFRVTHPDGAIHWLLSRGQWSATSGAGGQMIGVVQDITPEVKDLEELRSAKIRAEQAAQLLAASELRLRELTHSLEARVSAEVAAREAAQSRLAHAQRLQAVGQLTGGVAHDFNNVLTIIMGTIDALEQGVADRPRLAEFANMIGVAARRGAKLTANLLAFARKQPLKPQQADIHALLVQTCELLRSTLGGHLEINLVERSELGPAFVDPDQLSSAIVNLGINARDAMPNGGTLTIKADTELLGDDQADSRELAAGRYIVISVSDTGTGIPEDIQQKIFEPFFTTKDPGKGTGLGLSMVFGFVKQSGGHVEFSTQQDAGTTFRIYLPAVDATASSSSPAPGVMSAA